MAQNALAFRDVDLDAHAKLGPKDNQSRFLIKMLPPTSYSFQYGTSEDGIKWTTVMEGKASKVK